MLGYATPSPVATRYFSPTSVALIVAGHAALLALVVSEKTEFIPPTIFEPIKIIDIAVPAPPPPPPPDDTRTVHPSPPQPGPTRFPPIADPLPPIREPLAGPIKIDTGPYPGGGDVILDPPPKPHAVIHRPAILATPERLLRPPYPLSKQRLGEEASLALRLTIAPDGRVIAVDRVGRADPEFLAAARRHMLAHWRYRPASDDGAAVGSVISVTLSFRLDEAG